MNLYEAFGRAVFEKDGLAEFARGAEAVLRLVQAGKVSGAELVRTAEGWNVTPEALARVQDEEMAREE